MPAVVELLFVMIAAGIGAATGWLLRGGSARSTSEKCENEIRYAREVLARVHELAAHVAADVGEHTSRVEEINEELASVAAHETEAVASAVERLLQANNQMQEQLVLADEKLRDQARQIQSHASEARTDVLTGLANRRAFDDEMARCLAAFESHGRTFSVVTVDVDHFKKFNDTYGHQAGDAVLAGVAGVLRDNARSRDTVARYGGEEFATILPGASAEDAGAAAERVRQAIENTPFRFQGTDLHVTVSMGVAELLPKETVPGLIRRSDAALYASKQAGRNRVRWHDGREIYPLGGKPESPAQQARRDSERAEQPRAEAESPGGRRSTGGPLAAAAKARPMVSAELGPGDHDGPSDRAGFEAALHRCLEQWRRGGVPPCVLLVRVDHFGEIASRWGAEIGPLLLHVTLRFLNAAIPNRELLARYDAATFGVLLPGAPLVDTIGTAERVRDGIARCRLPTERGEVHFTVSASAAAAMEDNDTSGLLRRVEEALDAALKSGGDCSYFHNGQWSEMAQVTLHEIG